MVGEALSANVPLLILNRPSQKEDQNTISYLKQHHLCDIIDWDDFRIYQVGSLQKSRVIQENMLSNDQAEKIAADLLGIILGR